MKSLLLPDRELPKTLEHRPPPKVRPQNTNREQLRRFLPHTDSLPFAENRDHLMQALLESLLWDSQQQLSAQQGK